MKRPVASLLIVLVVMAAGTAAGQGTPADSIPLRKCDDLKVPIGLLPKAAGTVTFRLGKDGKADTTSLGVVNVLGLSVAAFRSVAARQLSACRFDVEKVHLSGPATVAVPITTVRSEVTLGAATVATDARPPLAVEPFTIPRDTMPFAVDDRRVEERPRSLTCASQVRAPTVIHATGATPAQAQADAREQVRVANLQFNQTNSGSLTALVRVAIDGKPGSQIRVIELTNPAAGQSLGDRIGSCRYVPGRILGVLVPAFMEMTVP